MVHTKDKGSPHAADQTKGRLSPQMGKGVSFQEAAGINLQMEGACMTTRQQVLAYGLTFPETYVDKPFHDDNWVLVRCRKNKKAFLWTYVYGGQLRVNVKVAPQWRDFWRQIYPSVIPGYHQNKEHWNTLILDGTIPEKDIKRMIGESYDLVSGKHPETGKRK